MAFLWHLFISSLVIQDLVREPSSLLIRILLALFPRRIIKTFMYSIRVKTNLDVLLIVVAVILILISVYTELEIISICVIFILAQLNIELVWIKPIKRNSYYN